MRPWRRRDAISTEAVGRAAKRALAWCSPCYGGLGRLETDRVAVSVGWKCGRAHEKRSEPTISRRAQKLRRKTRLAEGEARDEGASAELSDMQRRGSSDAR